jgi:hypothetical protein
VAGYGSWLHAARHAAIIEPRVARGVSDLKREASLSSFPCVYKEEEVLQMSENLVLGVLSMILVHSA